MVAYCGVLSSTYRGEIMESYDEQVRRYNELHLKTGLIKEEWDEYKKLQKKICPIPHKTRTMQVF